MRDVTGLRPSAASCVLAAGLVLVPFAARTIAQRFSNWSPPVNLGPIVNSSAFDG